MINPILASSTRRRMRTVKTPIILSLYALVLTVVVIGTTMEVNAGTIRLQTMRSGIEAYIIVLTLQFCLTLLVTPAMTAGSIAGERERQTLELLLVTNTGSFRIVFGKLLENFAFIALMIFSALPALSVVLMCGGITVFQVLTAVLFMIVTAFGALCVGLFCSAVFSRTVTATVATYLAIFALGVGTLFPIRTALVGLMTEYQRDYQAIAAASQAGLFGVVPLVLLVNPGIGFLCMLADQTMLLESTLSSFTTGKYLYNIAGSIDFGLFAWLNMAVVVIAGLALILLSALLVRPRRRARRVKA